MKNELKRDDLLYPDLSYQVVGVLFRIHRDLGNRYQERYYQRAIAVGLEKQKIPFEEQVLVKLDFEGVSIGRYFVDFVIDDKVVLEIKTVDRLALNDYRQIQGYLRALDKELGITANFRTENLRYRRVLNPAARTIR